MRELPDVGKVDAEDGGLPIVCPTGFRTRSRARREIGVPDLSSQVCTTDEFSISVLITVARLVGL